MTSPIRAMGPFFQSVFLADRRQVLLMMGCVGSVRASAIEG